MRYIKIVIILFFLSTLLYSQDLLFQHQFGEFENATAFTFTPSGYFYITDAAKNEVIKLDTLGKLIQGIGGYGWETSTFDEPVDIYATDLRVFVTDKNNNRIQVFDKDLNYLFLIKTDNHVDEQNNFLYPQSSVTSIQGDVYILDSDNSQIMKYNSEGLFLIDFGGYESGEFVLEQPTKIGIAHDSKIFVLDDQRVTVFDQFGMGLFLMNLKFPATNLNITFDNLVISDEKNIYYLNLRTPDILINSLKPTDIPDGEVIVEALVINSRLYILTETNILVYLIIKS
ncbi:MAG: NHL repeat-containing protein [Bacteroidota bacterium]